MVEIRKILFDADTIAARVKELASLVSEDYAGKELVLVCILKGAAIFTADLMRHITVPATLEFVQAASYGASRTSSRKVRITRDLKKDFEGRHVLLVDTIIDSGATLHALHSLYSGRNAASMNSAVLLDKTCRRIFDVPIAYKGFHIPDEFVVGYGLDSGGQYRNLPYIAALETDTE